MSQKSLRKRFFINTAIVAATVMFISVMVVDFSYKDELKKSTYETLRLHIFTLLSVAQIEKGVIYLPDILYNPRLNTSKSGLWAAVLDENEKPLWHSLSIDSVPDDIQLGKNIGDWQFSRKAIGKNTYFVADYKIAWDDGGQRYTYHFISAENENVINAIVTRFRRWLFGSFVMITATLLLCQFIALRLTFRPIAHLESEISLLEQGKKSTLSDDYPIELEGVTQNLNALIDKEYRQRERYRTSMADLAHSLKTPMTIISSEMTNYANNPILQNAVERIDKNIEYQLRRAVISGHNLQNHGTKIKEVVELVAEAFTKIYQDSDIALTANIDSGLLFLGDENDLTEILGNLLDNAYKHAVKTVEVSIEKRNDLLTIAVGDDGPGLTESDSENIFTRGERLDSKGLGQGIGLAVVADIVNSYHGHIETSISALGGAKFILTFPNKGSFE